MAEERLRIVLSAAGASGVQGSLRSVQGAVSALQSSAARVAGVLGIGGLGAAFVAMTKAAIDSASQIVDSADKLGISTKAYQELGYAAKQAGVDQAAFDTALSKLSVNISKAADGTGAAADTFAALGVKVKDASGNIRPTTDILADIADRFRDLKNPADRARVAVELFSRGGVSLVNVLREGGAALRDQAARARELGIVLTDEALRGMEALGDELDTVGAQMEAARGLIVSGMLPALKLLADATLKAAAGWNELLGGFQQTKRLEAEAQLAKVRTEIQGLNMDLVKLSRDRPGENLFVPNARINSKLAALKAQEQAIVGDLNIPPPATPPKRDGAAFDPDAGSDAKKAAAAAKKLADDFAKDIETLRESAAKSTFAMAGLVLDEFAAARTEAARGLSETMREIEKTEAHAVEVAKGSIEKIRQAREEANRAELAAIAKFEADKTSIAKKETEERDRIEKKRRDDNERFIESIQTEASPDVAAVISQAKASSLDLQQILTEGLGNALSAFGQGAASAFEEFIFGTKSAAEAFQDFAAQTLKSIADVIIQMLVMAAVQKAIGFVTGVSGQLADVNRIANMFASGGIVTRPTLGLIGEGGEPEAIVPLSKAQQMGFGGGEITVVTNVTVNAGGGVTSQTGTQGAGQSGATLARLVKGAVVEVIRNEQRSGGLLAQSRNA